VHFRAALASCLLLLAAAAGRAEIGIGDTRDEVLRQHGKPASVARRGTHEIFLYPKGGRVELVDGKVVDVKSPLPAAPAPSAAPAAPVERAPPDAKAAPDVTSAPTTPDPEPPPATTWRGEFNPAVAANELAKHVEKMDTAWGVPQPAVEISSPLDSLPAFLTGLLLRFGFTIFALKVAFRYWEMDAFWRGILAIAGIDVVVHAICGLLGPATGGFSTMVAVENGASTLVMIYTIYRFCFNKRVQNAVITAVCVKLELTLCYLFVGLGALNLIFG
jgi:hypothetical protein